MKTICPEELCTGCTGCANVCTRKAISMEEDEYGRLRPAVDEGKCTDCGLCARVCPNNAATDFRYPLECFASWTNDRAKRRICASGGIGTVLSEHTLRHGGVVFGSRYDEKLEPVMAYTEKAEDLEYFKGSRYVQSRIGYDTFIKVKEFLAAGRNVLFVGTPCQVAGLKAFLRKDYDRLITVDLICHGVCPSKYLREEVAYLSKKYNLKNITDIRFRGNDGKNFILSLWDKSRNELFPGNALKERLLKTKAAQQYYLTGFLTGVTLRENCYSCRYARPERISDITIGDFIGIGKKEPFEHPKENVSVVTTNTQRGAEFFSAVRKDSPDLTSIKRDYGERLLYKPSLVTPFPRHRLTPEFMENYRRYGYVSAIRKTLKYEMQKRRLLLILRLHVVATARVKHRLTNLKRLF